MLACLHLDFQMQAMIFMESVGFNSFIVSLTCYLTIANPILTVLPVCCSEYLCQIVLSLELFVWLFKKTGTYCISGGAYQTVKDAFKISRIVLTPLSMLLQ